MTTSIQIRDVRKHFDGTLALDGVSLEIAAGEMFFLLGPSGCGKTTLLRVLAGFVQPEGGDVFFGDQRITPLPPRLRGAGMVFQTYALWPHLSVAKNVAYGLQVRGVGRSETASRVAQALKMVHMEGFGERKPAQLSGGQQQRVALARALVIEPRVVLLDEPLSNLDARLRDEMREEIRRLHRETGLTMVYVTHDQKEALALADRLAVMKGGKLMQVGAPLDVYSRPASRFVAGFLGDCNFVTGALRASAAGTATIDTPLGPLLARSLSDPAGTGKEVTCSFRPQDVVVNAAGDGPNQFAGEVEQVSFLGEMVHVRVLAGAGRIPLLLAALPQTAGRFKPGDRLALAVPAEQVVLLEE